MAVNYLHRFDSVDPAAMPRGARRSRTANLALRGLVAAVAAAWLAGPGVERVILAAAAALGSVALPLLRSRASMDGATLLRSIRPEMELAVNAAFVVGSAPFVLGGHVVSGAAAGGTAEGSRAAVALLAAAGVVFLVRGGTHVVRGVLEKSDTALPSVADQTSVRHGSTIGNLEQFLVFALAVGGQFGALGLVVAAKGLVRAAEWRDRTLLEYFLVGTLASVTLALVVGLLVRAAVLAWW